MDIAHQRPIRKRAATKRYIHESENYGVPQLTNGAHDGKGGSVEKAEEEEDDSMDEVTEEIEEEEEEESDKQPTAAVEIRRSCRTVEQILNKDNEKKERVKEYAVIPDFVADVDTEKDKEDNDHASNKNKHQTQKNVKAFLEACGHLNVETALRFLKYNDLKTSIELGNTVQLPNQRPGWLDKLLLSDPTCLRHNQDKKGERHVVLADKLKNVVSKEVFMEAAFKAKGHRPIDHVQLLVDVAPKEYTPESGKCEKKKYKEPTRKSGGSSSSTSAPAARANQGENSTSRRSGRRTGAQKDSGEGPNPNDEKPDTSALYSLRPKVATEEVHSDQNIPTHKYETYTHFANDGSGASTTAYRPIVPGSTIKFMTDEQNNGSQPSTSGPVRQTNHRSNPSRRARKAVHYEEDDEDDDEDEGKTVRVRPSCSQGKKK